MALPRILVLLTLAAVPLAGCVDDATPPPAIELDSEDNGTNDTLPDGREFAALEETNKTEKGLGGRIHKHDYWGGQDRVLVFDDVVEIGPIPVFPSRDDTNHLFVGYLALGDVPGEERPALVFEGTGLVEFTITQAPPWMQTARVSFRTAAQDWTERTPIQVGEPFTYAPTAVDNDVPHSVRSLWNWEVTADSPPAFADCAVVFDTFCTATPDAQIRVQITVVKANDVVEWPGHPAFYDEVEKRVVVDNVASRTTVQSAADVLIYGVEPDQVVPDKLIGVGTGSLDVWVNVSKIDAPVETSGFTLFWRSADIPEYELGYNPGANESDGKTWAHWHLVVNETMVDAFYQPTSRFTFKVLADAGPEAFRENFARCYRCVPYTIEYTMTVIANKDPDYVPPVDDPTMA